MQTIKKRIIVLALIGALLFSTTASANYGTGTIYNYPYTGSYGVGAVTSTLIGGNADVTNQVALVGGFTVSVQGTSYRYNGSYYVSVASYYGSNTAGLSNYVSASATAKSGSYVYVDGNCTVNGGWNLPILRVFL